MRTNSARVELSPVPVGHDPARRLPQLLVGLALYATSMALLIRAQLGVMPWDVLHQGLAWHLGWSFGAVTALTGALVLAAWVPLRQRPGVGTVANVVVIAVVVDLVLAVLPPAHGLTPRAGLLIGGVVLNALATAAYVGARLGPGPRDGLMTGLCARTGWSVRWVRTGIEVAVVLVGWLLGGGLGLGTLLYALAIGPLTQLFLPLVAVRGSGPAHG